MKTKIHLKAIMKNAVITATLFATRIHHNIQLFNC